MNLRKRSSTSDSIRRPDVKKKKRTPLRRSERNKIISKDEPLRSQEPNNNTSQKENRPKNKRKNLGWSRKKKPFTEEECPSALLFPPIIETGFADALELLENASSEVIYIVTNR